MSSNPRPDRAKERRQFGADVRCAEIRRAGDIGFVMALERPLDEASVVRDHLAHKDSQHTFDSRTLLGLISSVNYGASMSFTHYLQ